VSSGSEVLNVTIACDEAVTVPEAATRMSVAVTFGPASLIRAVSDVP
jgi:hypothetical protein